MSDRAKGPRAPRSCSVTILGSVDWRQAELQSKGLQQTVQRVPCGIVTWVERPQEIRARQWPAGSSRASLRRVGFQSDQHETGLPGQNR